MIDKPRAEIVKHQPTIQGSNDGRPVAISDRPDSLFSAVELQSPRAAALSRQKPSEYLDDGTLVDDLTALVDDDTALAGQLVNYGESPNFFAEENKPKGLFRPDNRPIID